MKPLLSSNVPALVTELRPTLHVVRHWAAICPMASSAGPMQGMLVWSVTSMPALGMPVHAGSKACMTAGSWADSQCLGSAACICATSALQPKLAEHDQGGCVQGARLRLTLQRP